MFRESNPPEHSGGRGRAVVLDVFQRGAVRRIYAAHRFFPNSIFTYSPKAFVEIPDKIHVSFFFFFFSSSSSFFFLGGFSAYSPKAFRAHLREKVRQYTRKSASKGEKKCVNMREKVRQHVRERLTYLVNEIKK